MNFPGTLSAGREISIMSCVRVVPCSPTPPVCSKEGNQGRTQPATPPIPPVRKMDRKQSWRKFPTLERFLPLGRRKPGKSRKSCSHVVSVYMLICHLLRGPKDTVLEIGHVKLFVSARSVRTVGYRT